MTSVWRQLAGHSRRVVERWWTRLCRHVARGWLKLGFGFRWINDFWQCIRANQLRPKLEFVHSVDLYVYLLQCAVDVIMQASQLRWCLLQCIIDALLMRMHLINMTTPVLHKSYQNQIKSNLLKHKDHIATYNARLNKWKLEWRAEQWKMKNTVFENKKP